MLFRSTTSGPGTSVFLSSGVQPATLKPPGTEVRFDVCTPAAGDETCGTFDDPPDQYLPGRFGLQFGGTLGDFFKMQARADIKKYEGQEVTVEGTVSLFEKLPQVVVNVPGQVKK